MIVHNFLNKGWRVMGLPEVIRVDKTKCQHCLACILVCPVKLCNIVEPDGITVKADLCIGCGECIRACREKGHNARSGIDDFPEFLQDLRLGVPLGIMVAPSAAANYANLLPQVLTALRKIGVSNIFDVSFGAEITTYLYLQALQSGAKLPIIAQPCPAIVSFIEIYQTELIPYLAPTHSPALDVAIWLKSQSEFKHLKLAFLGPCLAKRREVHDPNTKGVVNYSITFESLDKYFLEQSINLLEMQPSGFDTPEAERAVGFSQPGGLTDTFNRFGVQVQKSDIPRVEGPQEVYLKYLPELMEDIRLGSAPILVDILNCQHGCNVGPASTHHRTHFQVAKIMEERKKAQITKHESISEQKAKILFEDFFTWLDSEKLDFSRSYSDKSSNKFLREPALAEEEQTWQLMHKLSSEERKINCASCGYGNCRGMMLAIVNGLNHLESCKYYLFKENERNLKNLEAQTIEIEEARDEIAAWNEVLEETVALRTQSIRNLLNNAGQGFLSFGLDLRIHDEYSTECNRIFAKDIHGFKFSRLLFPNDEDQISFLEALLSKILKTQDESLREIYLPLLPPEVMIGNKFISIDYKIIYQSNKSENFCMAILTDITDHRSLESLIEQERNLLKMVVEVVVNFNDFILNVRDFQNFCEVRLQEIINSNKTLENIVTEIYRHVHTFKGNFSQLGLISVIENLHDLESQIVNFKKNIGNKNLQDVKEFFAGFLIFSWLEKDMAGLHDILGEDFFSQEDELVISKHKLLEIEKKITTLLSPSECKMLIPELRKLRHRPLDTLLKSYPEYVANLAERLEKLIYPVVMNTEIILVNPDLYHDFTNSLVHVFRNAVDHGLEAPDERLDKGKDEYGNIVVSLTSKEKQIILSIKDDGRGIDAGIIRSKAVESGIRTVEEVERLTDDEAVQLIFADGFSTKEDVDELSGRGVGLAAVLDELTKLGGFLRVKTEINKGTEFSFSLPTGTDGLWGVSIAELMQPLINTTCKFFREQANLTVNYQDSFRVYEPNKLDLFKVTAIINIRGALEIAFIMSFEEPVLRKIVHNFVLGELTSQEEDQYLEDVLAEVTNIILGNSLKEFPGLEELVIIDTPISISSDEVMVKYLKAQIWICKMQTELGDLSLSLVIPRILQ